jgi:hypothetical protein
MNIYACTMFFKKNELHNISVVNNYIELTGSSKPGGTRRVRDARGA